MKGLILGMPLLLACLSVQASSTAPVTAAVTTEHVTVTLLSDQPQPVPGQPFWLALHFELIPHWHVYWRNPGASGAAPVVRWTLPEGWHAGEIHWPVPERIRVGPLTNYGYEGSVTFLVPVSVPRGPSPAGPLTVAAEAEWLVCREECIPETGRFVLQLDGPGDPVAAAETDRLFAAARAQWPEDVTLGGRYRMVGDTIVIAVDIPGLPADVPADVWFAANQWGPVDASGAQEWERAADALTLGVPVGDLPPAGDTALDGLLVVESDDRGSTVRRGYRVRLAGGAPAAGGASPGLVTALVFALLGGHILNVMP